MRPAMTETTPDYAGLLERLDNHFKDAPKEVRSSTFDLLDDAAEALRILLDRNAALERERDEFRSKLAETIGKLMVAEAKLAALTGPEGDMRDYHEGIVASLISRAEAAEARVKELETLMRKAHAVMRECGWQLAISAEPQGDGILEAACTEIEADFADALSARALKENGNGE